VQRRGFIGRLESRVVGELGSVASLVQAKPYQAGPKIIAHLDNRLRAGEGAMRPVLQEVGDGITTVTWGTWIGMNPNSMTKSGLKYNMVVKVETSAGSVEGSVYPLPGLHEDTIAIPRGNGRDPKLSKISAGIGFDPLVLFGAAFDAQTGMPVTRGAAAKITATGRIERLAAQQKHNDVGNRSDIIKSISLQEATDNFSKKKDLDTVPDLYPELPKAEYRWGMSIDLGKCIGCSACMVACASENNVAQVGKEQILLGREMHWIRIDRYYTGSLDNPHVTFQPMLCQHCNHAPCEPVCPVYATTHDPEGLNSQTYNRCIGTRYCANACPYKVRRFNWFTYGWNMVGDRAVDRNPRALNPDVTVRTRGVMEKCTFCVQRIRDVKHAVKERGEGAQLFDGEIKTACEQVCPTNAITFGNLNDPQSRVSALRKDNRAYLALNGDPEHKHYGLKTVPNVNYIAKVTHEKMELTTSSHATSTGHGEAGEH
jgi:molybdopterin-containing oxidoreductase family iron-sulfur binding subunit